MNSFIQTVAASAVCALTSLPAFAAEKIPLAELNAYFNDLKTAQSGFTQISDDGSIATGTLKIKRPWKMRFEYDGDGSLVLASARAVAIFDPKGNPQPETYPLKRTPLWLILAPNVALDRSNTVIGHDFDGTATVVTAQDPENPDLGQLQLVFTDNPIQLRQWVVNEPSGGSTTVVLGPLDRSVSLRNSAFSISDEIERRDPSSDND